MASRYDKNTDKQTEKRRPTPARKGAPGLNPLGDVDDRLVDGIEDQSSTRFTDDVATDEDMLFDDSEAEASIRVSRVDDDRVADLEVLRRELEERNARFKKEKKP